MLLQAARGAVRWPTGQHPASVFVFRCQVSTDRRRNFDYVDIFQAPFFAMRFGEVAVVALLQDWGSLQDTVEVPMFQAASAIALHPLQFQQVAAMGILMAVSFYGS